MSDLLKSGSWYWIIRAHCNVPEIGRWDGTFFETAQALNRLVCFNDVVLYFGPIPLPEGWQDGKILRSAE